MNSQFSTVVSAQRQGKTGVRLHALLPGPGGLPRAGWGPGASLAFSHCLSPHDPPPITHQRNGGFNPSNPGLKSRPWWRHLGVPSMKRERGSDVVFSQTRHVKDPMSYPAKGAPQPLMAAYLLHDIFYTIRTYLWTEGCFA